MLFQTKFAVLICCGVFLSCQRATATHCTHSSRCSDTQICCTNTNTCCDRRSCSTSIDCPGSQNCCRKTYNINSFFSNGYCCDGGSTYCDSKSDCSYGYKCCKYDSSKGGFCCDNDNFEYFNLNIGAIVGIAVGSISGFVILIIGIVCCCKHTVCRSTPVHSIVYAANLPGVAVVSSSQTNNSVCGQQMQMPPVYRPPMPYSSNVQPMHGTPKY